MNQKQKIFLIILLITVIIITFILVHSINTSVSQRSDKLKIVTTFYPLTFMAQQIGGDYVEITQLIPNNSEIHNWEPSTSHIKDAEDADIIFYNGADADHWMEDELLPALSTSNSKTIVETTNTLTLIINNEQEPNDAHEHEQGSYDPHTWISPYIAKQQAEIIYNTIVAVDPQHGEYYTQRWHSLKQQFVQLDTAYRDSLVNTSKHSIFVSHGAFSYLADRYGFTQQSVIGLSADEQPSAITIVKLIEDMKKYQNYVLYVDPVYSSNYVQIIQTDVQAQTGQSVIVLKLYLMLGPLDNLDYLEQMQTNLANLQTGLGAY